MVYYVYIYLLYTALLFQLLIQVDEDLHADEDLY